MSTRFQIPIQPKDGSPHSLLYTDVAEIIVPRVGDALTIWDGFTTEILDVTISPTMDPMVWVRGRAIFPETQAVASQISRRAKSEEGWKELW